jgi:hypothetical protein
LAIRSPFAQCRPQRPAVCVAAEIEGILKSHDPAQAFTARFIGLHDASVAAFRAAIDAGYGIELDIQPSRDSVPMVFHDYTWRLTENSPSPRSAADLAMD